MHRRLAALVLLAAILFGAALLLRRPGASPPAVEADAEVVPIVDGMTIDFSSGTPEMRDTPADRAAMEAALAEVTLTPLRESDEQK